MARRPDTGTRAKPVRLLAALVAIVLAGGAAFLSAAGGDGSFDPAADSVRALGGAPVLWNGGHALNAHLVGIAATATGRGYWLAASDGGVFALGDARFEGSTASIALVAPVVGIAATPDGGGYWLAGADGGVFAFGDADFYGSLGDTDRFSALVAPIVGIAATPSGRGYWLVGADGGVFAFGDARFAGSAVNVPRIAPVSGIARTSTGRGYWLLGADGGVFAFGDARFFGSSVDPTRAATAIAAVADDSGYWIARADGDVDGIGRARSTPAAADLLAARHPVVGVAARVGGGLWLALGSVPPPPPAQPDLSQDPFLVCTRAHESDGAGGYHAVSPGGTYRGAYQFTRSTWNSTAMHAGRPDLVGIDPAAAAPYDQDLLALDLYHWQGASPWGGRCAGLA